MNSEELIDKLVLWIRDTALAAGCGGTVVGMSGGIDSSVLAVLCHRACGRSALGLIMPCHSHGEDQQHARMTADKFSLPTKTVVLDGAFDTLLEAFPDEGTTADGNKLARANLKARLRMTTLYYHANHLKYLVAGTGNRSELAVGYFTKYGDGGADILPLGNLVKGQIAELAVCLGIPQEIIDKPPSAGLWHGQTDEDELGLSYDELDRYLVDGQAGNKVRQKIEAMMARSQHKRQLPLLPDF